MRNKNLFSISVKRKMSKIFLLGRVNYGFNKKPLSFYQSVTRMIKGIGNVQVNNLVKTAGLNPLQKLNIESLTDLSLGKLESIERRASTSLSLDRTLDRFVDENIQRKIKAGTYKGQMFLFGLPVRGQRTKTNAMTAKKTAKYKQGKIEENTTKNKK